MIHEQQHNGPSAGRLDLQALISELRASRTFLEKRWREWKDDQQPGWDGTDPCLSYGMCRFSSLFLRERLNEIRVSDARWRVAGGLTGFINIDPGWNGVGGPDQGGILSGNGEWKDHYWVTNDNVIVDVTADQFGLSPIMIALASDSRYLENWKPPFVQDHLLDVEDRVFDWLDVFAAGDDPVSQPAAAPSTSQRW